MFIFAARRQERANGGERRHLQANQGVPGAGRSRQRGAAADERRGGLMVAHLRWMRATRSREGLRRLTRDLESARCKIAGTS